LITRPTSVVVLAALVLAACATAPNPKPPERVATEESAATREHIRLPSSPATAQGEDADYSPAALFHETHGEFYSNMDRFKPSTAIRFLGLPDAELHHESGEFDSWQIGGEGIVPFVTDPDSAILLGGVFDARRIKTSQSFGFRDETLYEIGLYLGYGHFFTDDLYVEGVFNPGIFSDLGGSLKSDDWQWQGRSLATIRASEDLFWKVGVEVSNVFQKISVYPLAGVSWILDPSWRVDVLAPRSAELSYLVNSAATVFVGVGLDGEQYRRRSSASTGKVQSNIQTQNLEIYLGGIYRFTDHFSSFARFGSVVAGNWDFGRPGQPNIDGRIEPTIMFEAGIGWDF